MRQLKYHEKKLLRKVDFLQWKNEKNQRELQVSPRCLGRACGSLKLAHSHLMPSSFTDFTAVGVCRSSGGTTYRTGMTTRSTTRSAAWSRSWCPSSSAWIPRTPLA